MLYHTEMWSIQVYSLGGTQIQTGKTGCTSAKHRSRTKGAASLMWSTWWQGKAKSSRYCQNIAPQGSSRVLLNFTIKCSWQIRCRRKQSSTTGLGTTLIRTPWGWAMFSLTVSSRSIAGRRVENAKINTRRPSLAQLCSTEWPLRLETVQVGSLRALHRDLYRADKRISSQLTRQKMLSLRLQGIYPEGGWIPRLKDWKEAWQISRYLLARKIR